ncbi:hypothetical protein PPSIR1_38014 [Plesiocystis pacifica SIR-1]|uniref:Uncharacterized protein n=1 Tax=Plesiocystis pacifica SIR-1 TaxID=391625 RepID=A6G9P2_9BACT|nr:hypothetical protein [Plesiocystis pacifica]EDM77436.1 hypothetical protein PPSIR1_38014 [Plesiocystis pacifica SIR-1]
MTKKSTIILPVLFGFALSSAPRPALADYRDLCDSAPVCEYTGPDAPVLDADVCLDATGQVHLKGSVPCAAGAVPFHVRYGEVYDPIAQLVVAYTPLADACAQPGMCEPMLDGPVPPTNAEAICCVGAICWPGSDCGGTLFWCEDGVSNEDGTVTCFDASDPLD